jgi:hypothetical protein
MMETKQDRYDRRNNRSALAPTDVEQRDDQRRSSNRLQLRLWTEGRSEGRLDFHNCSNLSDDGIFIETTSPYPLHEAVDIEFNLPGVHDPIRVRARVVSVLDEDNAGASIMGNGFSFEHIGPAEINLIRSYIDASELAAI